MWSTNFLTDSELDPIFTDILSHEGDVERSIAKLVSSIDQYFVLVQQKID